MSLFCCDNESGCTLGAVVASIIIGIIAAFLGFTAVIAVAPAFLWTLFGIAVVYLAIVLLVSAFGAKQGSRRCICTSLPALLVGILGLILTSVILLGVSFAATSVVGAIFTGLLLAFFSLTVAQSACLAYCFARCSEKYEG